MTPKCPQCGGRLWPVRKPSESMLNDDQDALAKALRALVDKVFDSIRAGDWYCEKCPGKESNTGYKYFWDKEL